MIVPSRRGSVHTVQGFRLSRFPQVRHTWMVSITVCMAGGKRRHQRLALLDQMEHGAARRGAQAQARHPRQQLDQPLDLGSGNGGGHGVELQWLAGPGIPAKAGEARAGNP